MKKIITIICALGVTLCMTACGAENKTTDAGQTDQNVEMTVSAEDASQTEEPVKDETSETTVVTEPAPEPVKEVEVSKPVEEVAEPVEVEEEEEPEPEVDDTSNLSNEDWVKSLVMEKGTFLVFNTITGERKVLEDGQQYTLQDGDELAIKLPGYGWKNGGVNPLHFAIFDRTDYYYSGVFDMDSCRSYLTEGEFSELTFEVTDPEGNKHLTTLYLSK